MKHKPRRDGNAFGNGTINPSELHNNSVQRSTPTANATYGPLEYSHSARCFSGFENPMMGSYPSWYGTVNSSDVFGPVTGNATDDCAYHDNSHPTGLDPTSPTDYNSSVPSDRDGEAPVAQINGATSTSIEKSCADPISTPLRDGSTIEPTAGWSDSRLRTESTRHPSSLGAKSPKTTKPRRKRLTGPIDRSSPITLGLLELFQTDLIRLQLVLYIIDSPWIRTPHLEECLEGDMLTQVVNGRLAKNGCGPFQAFLINGGKHHCLICPEAERKDTKSLERALGHVRDHFGYTIDGTFSNKNTRKDQLKRRESPDFHCSPCNDDFTIQNKKRHLETKKHIRAEARAKATVEAMAAENSVA